MINLKKINVNDIEGYHIGNAEYKEAATGLTVILPDTKTVCGVDIRGGAPASRETGLLNPLAANDQVHAVVLSGGSAFGLNSASGVMQYLEERNIGFPTAAGVVPIVSTSCIFDLTLGDNKVRPDHNLAYLACKNAEEKNYQDGNFGAGCGATAGKFMGPEHTMKTGIGSAAFQIGDLQVGAIVAVNCAGDVFDYRTNEKIAGVINYDNNEFISSEEILYSSQLNIQEGTNTTIGAIITNADFNKTELTKIAGMGHDGMARAINPIHTMFDGDSLYALGNGKVKSDINLVGTLAAKAVAEAIANAAYNAKPEYNLKSNQSI